MRFIGNKEKLLNNIHDIVLSLGIKDGVFCDFFSGTSSVGRFFKEHGFNIISSDLLYSSYVLQKAYIENNEQPRFTKLLQHIDTTSLTLVSTPLEDVLHYLNTIKGLRGFIWKNYTEGGTKNKKFLRKYFSSANGQKIDAIRTQIETWKTKKLINDNEYSILLASLVESVPFYANISGVYAAFLKTYDPRALKDFRIRPLKIYESKKKHKVYNKNSMDIIGDLKCDILYLDPPYNSRQYGGNYHLLETITKYDNPKIKGVTGMRNYDNQKSEFCNRITALKALDEIAQQVKFKFLLLSYNSEGIMSKREIFEVLKKYGSPELHEINYRRFRSNSNGESKTKEIIKEQIYILRRS